MKRGGKEEVGMKNKGAWKVNYEHTTLAKTPKRGEKKKNQENRERKGDGGKEQESEESELGEQNASNHIKQKIKTK